MSVVDALNQYLVHNPRISNFVYIHGSTFASSYSFLFLTIFSYLSLAFFLYAFAFPPLSPPLLRFISAVHNLIILVISATMAVAITLSSFYQMPALHWIFCFPANRTPPRGPVFFWAYVFYLSKILEFLDTVLIILSGSKRRLSFLHVYHHATVLVMCYLWLETSQSLFPVALVTNASVHTVMYAYYLLCTLGIRPSWKRLVTNCQIIQFVFSFLVSIVMLYYHFYRFQCSGFGGWCFNAVFNASLLYLFLDFHSKNYNKKKLGNDSKVVGDMDKGL